ncbi:hypothetical protein CR513_46571, partial [Mucuna pruriens]
MSKAEWTRHLDEVSKKSIHWYPQCNERDDTIIRCGAFPNVPLISTQGAINYNPKLVLRQAGYPMALPPFDEAITPFVIHDLGVQNGECLKKIRQAWRSVIRKGLEWGPRSCRASSSYKAWLKNILEAMENKVEALEQQKQDLKGEVSQLKE